MILSYRFDQSGLIFSFYRKKNLIRVPNIPISSIIAYTIRIRTCVLDCVLVLISILSADFLFCLLWWYVLYILSRGVKINKLVTLACRLSGGRRLDRFLVFAPRRSCHRIDQKKKKIGFCSFLSPSLQLRPWIKKRLGLTRLAFKVSSLIKFVSKYHYKYSDVHLRVQILWLLN